MSVPTGYKRTEVGVIPEEWGAATLRDHLVQNATYGVVKAGAFQRSGVPMLRGGDIKEGKLLTELPFITEGKNKEYARTVLRENDVVIALVGYPGESALVPAGLSGANISRAVGLLRLRYNLRPDYLVCLLNSPDGRKEFLRPSAGSAQLVVNLGALNQLRLPLPPLPEQRAIAESLGDVDALLGALDAAIAKQRDLKQATMQQLLTGQTRLPGFQGEWDEVPFGNVFSRVNAKEHQVQTSEYQITGRFPVVDQGQLPVVGHSDRNDKLFHVPEGGVIVFGDHTCIVKFVDFDFIVGADGTQIIAAKPGQCARFHYYQLQHHGIESTGYNRHFRFLRESTFCSAPFAEQLAIAAVLADFDMEVSVLESRRAKTAALKQAMMQSLLTGRIRLV